MSKSVATAPDIRHGNMQVPGGPKDAEKAAARPWVARSRPWVLGSLPPWVAHLHLVVLVRDGDARGKANAAGALQKLAAGDDAIKAAIAAAGAIKALV